MEMEGRKREREGGCRIRENSKNRFDCPVVDSSISLLLKLLLVLIIFVVGVVVGLVSSSHIDRYFIFPADQFDLKPRDIDTSRFTSDVPKIVVTCEREECLSMNSFIRPHNLSHGMTDEELFWRASLVSQKEEYPFKRVPRVAFMFMTRGPLPLLPLWERFFKGQDVEKYSIYVHTLPEFEFTVPDTSVFYGRQIPSQHVEWGSVSLVDAEKRLLANALLDFSNERFVLLSESCIPLHSFQTVYRYLIRSVQSFVESYDDPSRYGRGRYSRNMLPRIKLSDWRKGSQWFELRRSLAVKIVADTKYYPLFKKYCHPSCYPDEHYIPTYLHMFHSRWNANRSLTYVDWSQMGPHPASFNAVNITEGFVRSLRNNGTVCAYNSGTSPICYLFARKFDSSTLESLMNMTSKVIGF